MLEIRVCREESAQFTLEESHVANVYLKIEDLGLRIEAFV